MNENLLKTKILTIEKTKELLESWNEEYRVLEDSNEAAKIICEIRQNPKTIQIPIPTIQERVLYEMENEDEKIEITKDEILNGYTTKEHEIRGRKFPKGVKVFKPLICAMGEPTVNSATRPSQIEKMVLTNDLELMVEAFAEIRTCYSPTSTNGICSLLEFAEPNTYLCIGYFDNKPITRCLVYMDENENEFAVWGSYSKYERGNSATVAMVNYLTSQGLTAKASDTVTDNYCGLYSEGSDTGNWEGPRIKRKDSLLEHLIPTCRDCDLYLPFISNDRLCEECHDFNDNYEICSECGHEVYWEDAFWTESTVDEDGRPLCPYCEEKLREQGVKIQ